MCSPCLAEDGKIPFIRRGDNNVSKPSSVLRNDVIPCLDHGVRICADATPRNLPKARQIVNPFRWETILRPPEFALQTFLPTQGGQAVSPIPIGDQCSSIGRPPSQKCVS